MKKSELRRVPVFSGPEDTIFYFETSEEVWVISALDATEVRVPEVDLLEFVRHCLDYSDGPSGAKVSEH